MLFHNPRLETSMGRAIFGLLVGAASGALMNAIWAVAVDTWSSDVPMTDILSGLFVFFVVSGIVWLAGGFTLGALGWMALHELMLRGPGTAVLFGADLIGGFIRLLTPNPAAWGPYAVAGGLAGLVVWAVSYRPVEGNAWNDTARLIAGILRVNHGGEHGAVAIYRGQIALARFTAPDLVSPLKGILAHEIEHRAAFRALMPTRAARPCRLMGLWSLGGVVLGAATGLLGRRAILSCTAAVERTVHRHLVDQKHWLADRDPELARVIAEIEVEELEHLAFAEAGGHTGGVLAGPISLVTEALIWLATRGGSSRLALQ